MNYQTIFLYNAGT